MSKTSVMTASHTCVATSRSAPTPAPNRTGIDLQPRIDVQTATSGTSMRPVVMKKKADPVQANPDEEGKVVRHGSKIPVITMAFCRDLKDRGEQRVST